MWKNKMNEWINNENVSKELKQEIELMSEEQLEDCFYKNIDFGTAGMRGNMNIGPNKINVHTIAKASLGLSKYVNESSIENKVVVIAYDSRNNSKLFAKVAGSVLSNNNIKVMLFSEVTSTPVLSFAVRYFKAAAGIVITASHNPKTDNGFKAYNNTGSQLNLEEAKKLTNDVLTFTDYLNYSFESKNRDLIKLVSEEVYEKYQEKLLEIEVNKIPFEDTKFVFSPIYGTSWKFVEQAAKNRGIDIVNVKTESEPNGEFPGFIYPNPEAKEVFNRGIEISKVINGDAVFTTDPDADRLGLAINHNGEYIFINGNEQGILASVYLLHSRKIKNTLPDNGVILSSIVSTNLIEKISKYYNVTSEQVLTGFKFIGEKIEKYNFTNEKEYIFGFEESYGCLVKDFARDKDAIQATMLFSEMISFYKQKNLTLVDVLETIYQQFGYSKTEIISFEFKGSNGITQMQQIMNNFRNLDVIISDNVSLLNRVDYLNDQTGIPSADVIKYFNDDKSQFVFLRPSGTEPKLKIYLESITSSKEQTEKDIKIIKTMFMEMFNEFT